MAWVVKRWRTEGLERLLSEEARASAETTRAAAERDARRARRAADRAAADAAAELEALERLGAELRAMVRRRRASDARGDAWERAAPAVSGPATLLLAAAAVARAASEPGLRAVSAAPPSPARPAVAPTADPLGAPSRRPRPRRASMRSSALGELFRATAAR